MNEKASRAKQFLPFASLRGYYDQIKERQRIIEPRKERTDEDNDRLSKQINQIKKGMMIKVTHYDKDAYVTTEGLVTGIDLTFRTLTLVKTKIDLDEVFAIQSEELSEDTQTAL